jgi:hypothetical protein
LLKTELGQKNENYFSIFARLFFKVKIFIKSDEKIVEVKSRISPCRNAVDGLQQEGAFRYHWLAVQ